MSIRKRSSYLLGILILLICPMLAYATDYYVATDGNDSNNGLTTNTAWLTLSHAISASLGGDTIYVRAGTYTGSGYQTLIPKSGSASNYTIIQGYPGDVMPIIDANASAGSSTTVFTLNNSYIRLEGLHIKGGGGYEGGTITIGNNGEASNIIIDNCIISDTNNGGTLTSYNPAHIRIGYDGTANGVIIQKCNIYGKFASGLKIDGRKAQSITIKNNHIHNTLHGIAVKWGVSTDKNIVLSYNKIHDTKYRGFYIDQGYIRIEQNLVYNIGDYGIFANDNWNGNDLQIIHNTFYNCTINAIYLNAPNAVNATIFDNIIYNSGSTSIKSIALFPYSALAHNTTINYNGIFDNTTNLIYRENNSSYTYSQWRSYYSSDINSIQSDPLFVNPSDGDFRLKPNSPFKKIASDSTNIGANTCKVGINPAPCPPIMHDDVIEW